MKYQVTRADRNLWAVYSPEGDVVGRIRSHAARGPKGVETFHIYEGPKRTKYDRFLTLHRAIDHVVMSHAHGDWLKNSWTAPPATLRTTPTAMPGHIAIPASQMRTVVDANRYPVSAMRHHVDGLGHAIWGAAASPHVSEQDQEHLSELAQAHARLRDTFSKAFGDRQR